MKKSNKLVIVSELVVIKPLTATITLMHSVIVTFGKIFDIIKEFAGNRVCIMTKKLSFHIILLVWTLLGVSCEAKGNAEFDEFISKFAPLGEGVSWSEIFNDYDRNFGIPQSDSVFVEPMLKPDKDYIYDYTLLGCKIERSGDFYIAFFRREPWSKYYMEPQDYDEIVAVYAENGKLVDWKAVAADGKAYHAEIKQFNANPFELTVEQWSLQNMEMLDNDADPVYDVVEKHYSISEKGVIECTVIGEERTQSRSRDKDALSETSFKDLLKLFPEWNKEDVTADILGFPGNGVFNNEIDGALVRKYAPAAVDDCNCGSRGLWWRSGYRVSLANCLVLFIHMECESPIKEKCMYGDIILLTFTPDGSPIDNATLCRSGDYFEYRFIKGALNPFSIEIEQRAVDGDLNDKQNQTVTETTSTFRVAVNGKIEKSQQ